MVKVRTAWIGAAGVTLLVAVMQAMALADRSRGEPASDGIRRYVLGEITDGLRVEQQFLVKADGLSAVTIHPRATGDGALGTATVEVWDLTDPGGVVIARETLPLDQFVRTGAFTVAFAPQPSLYRTYGVVVTVTGSEFGHGAGLLAVRGDGHRDSALRVNTTRKWGDLIFETSVHGATSNFEDIASRLRGAGVPAPRVVFVLLLALQYAALFVAIRSVWPADAGHQSPELLRIDHLSPAATDDDTQRR